MSYMKVLQLIGILLWMPTIADAHSGTVLNTVVNYLPMALAAIPVLGSTLWKLFKKWRSIFIKERD